MRGFVLRFVLRFVSRLAARLVPVAALAAGCTVGPSFSPPHPDTPAQWHDIGRARAASSASPASSASSGASAVRPASATDAKRPVSTPTMDSDPDPRWWQSFRDPELDRLVARAAHDNLDLQQAVWRVIEARTQVQGAAAQGLPSLSANASYKREQVGAKGLLESSGIENDVAKLGAPNSPANQIAPGSGAALERGATNAINAIEKPINLWQAGFDASWELDLFGRVRRSVESARAQAQAAQESRNDALLSLEAEVAQTYIRLRGAQQLREIVRGLIDQQTSVVQLSQSRAHVGLASTQQVKAATAQLAQTRAELPQFDAQIARSLNALAYLLGEAPGAVDAELSAPHAVPPVPPTVPVGLPATLARRRPDIRRAEATLHAATANVGVAVAQFFPDISLTGQIGSRATRPHDLARWSHLFWSFGPSVSLPIFEGGALVSNLRLSKAEQQEAALGYRKTVLAALRDVDDALATYRTDQAHRDALATEVAERETSFELARDAYGKGLSSFIDVIDAERTLSQAREQLAQTTTQVGTDLVALYKALGGGWQSAGAGAAHD